MLLGVTKAYYAATRAHVGLFDLLFQFAQIIVFFCEIIFHPAHLKTFDGD